MTERTDDPDLQTIHRVDAHLDVAAMNMVSEGVTVRFALGRILSYAALQYVVNYDSETAAAIFREAAQNIEDGRLQHREGDKGRGN